MAENDIELSVGIKLDEAQFTQEYQSKLKEISKATRTQVQGAMDDISGPAAKQWGPLPFAGMHDPTNGNAVATQAFLASLAHDLQGAGYSGAPYESALVNATYRSSMPDPMQRYHRMLSMGLTQQADLTHPDTDLGKAIETDYQLMSQPWSRDFIKKGDKGSYIDFKGMREYAVDAGLGKWTYPALDHTPDNFELISDELEKVEDKSEKSNKTFANWNDTLKGVLGTLTAIGSLVGIEKIFEKAYTGSEKGTTQAGTTLDRKRAFVGMGALDVLATQVASQSIGLGRNAIYDEIVSMSNNREQYKLLGQGLNALFPALSGTFDNLMSNENPYEVYKGILSEVYKQLENADDETRARALFLLDAQGLGVGADVIGSFLSNPQLAAEMGNDPTNLFTLKSNKYYGVYNRGEALLPEITQLNESIKASYTQMAEDWEEAFGLPFKNWWNNTLQNTVVPWFEKILSMVKPEKIKELREDNSFNMSVLGRVPLYTNRDRNDKSGWFALTAQDLLGENNYKSGNLDIASRQGIFTKSGYNTALKLSKYDPNSRDSVSPRQWYSALEKLTNPKLYETGAIGADSFQSRALVLHEFLSKSGLGNSLGDLTENAVDKAIIRVGQQYLQTGDDALLRKFAAETFSHSDSWQELFKILKEYKDYFQKYPGKLDDVKVSIMGGQGGFYMGNLVDKAVGRQ